MLIHIVADYGHGDLAFAEVVQRIRLLERLVGHPLNTRIERPLLADPGADG